MSKVLSFRIPDELFDKLEEMAERAGIGRSELCQNLLFQAVESDLPADPVVARLASLEAQVRDLEGKLLGSNKSHSHGEPANRYTPHSLSDLLPQQASQKMA